MAATSVVGRAGALLKVVARHEPHGVTTSLAGREADLPRATAHRLLNELQTEGLTDRDPRTGRWLLGPELFFLGVSASARYDVREQAHPFVRRLADRTGESAFFSARRGDATVCLIREDGAFPVRSHVLFEGARFPLGVASAGMVILAFTGEQEREGYLERVDLTRDFGDQHEAGLVRQRVLETRRTGYTVNPGLLVPGSWGMAAAVFDHTGAPRWALSVTGIEHRFGPERRGRLGELLLKEAHALTTELGHARGTATTTE